MVVDNEIHRTTIERFLRVSETVLLGTMGHADCEMWRRRNIHTRHSPTAEERPGHGRGLIRGKTVPLDGETGAERRWSWQTNAAVCDYDG